MAPKQNIVVPDAQYVAISGLQTAIYELRSDPQLHQSYLNELSDRLRKYLGEKSHIYISFAQIDISIADGKRTVRINDACLLLETAIKSIEVNGLYSDPDRPDQKSRVKAFQDYLERNKITSILIIIGVVVLAVASFTDALGKIGDFFHGGNPNKDSSTPAISLTAQQLQTLIEHVQQRDPTSTSSPEQVVQYFDYIASESKKLSDIWQDIVHDFTSASLAPDDSIKRQLLIKYKLIPWPNGPYFSAVADFYTLYSKDLVSLPNEEWMEHFTMSMTQLISARGSATAQLDKIVSDLPKTGYFNTANSQIQIRNLNSSAQIILKEAEALQGLAVAVRAHYAKNSDHK